MTDYEKAILIMQTVQIELLQVIAWNGDEVSERDQERIRNAPVTMIAQLRRECPKVFEVIKR